MQELVTLLGSVSVLALLIALVTCALGLRRRAIRGGLGWAEALSQWWAWLRTERSAAPRHSRTGRVWRAFLVLAWVAGILFVPHQVQPVSASHVAGYSEYYILGDEDDILAALIAVNPRGNTGGSINSRVSLVVIADGANVYLDDDDVGGYNFDPGNPSGTADASWLGLPQGYVLTLTEAQADGGDRLYVTGAPVSVVRIVWADTPGPYLAGAWELYPLLAWQNSYVVPVGEDLDPPDYPDPFEYTFLFIEAAQNSTQVWVNGTPVATLNQGDNTYLSNINAGTTVTATGPIQAGLITSVNEVYDSRYYTLTPEEFLCNEYYLPVPSMQFPAGEFGGRDVETAAYIYAFEDNTTVTIRTGTGLPTTVPLDAGEVYRYVMPRAPAGTTEGPYGAQVTADNQIWILVAGDDNNPDLDWGYQAMCPSFLDDEYYLPYAPANPAHITPIGDDTTFFVDWDSDGVVDVPPFTLDRFDTRMLFDPDQDATGAHIYADGPFAIAWGQDNTEGTPGEPLPDFDYGYTILPLEPVEWLDPVLALEKTVDPPSLPAEGGAVQFTLVVSTEDYPVYNVDVSDVLPVGWEYVDNSTSIALSYDTGGSGPGYDPSISGDPSVSGYTLIWDLNGLGLNDTMPRNSSITLTYQARTIPGAYSAGLHDNLGQAYGEDQYGAIFRPEDHAFVFIPELPALSLAKTSDAGGLVNPGDTINYTIVISNVGVAPATNITVSDTLPTGTTYVPGTTQVTAGGATNPGGAPPTLVSPADGYGLLPGESMTVTFQVTVDDPLAPGITQIINTASVTSTEIITPSTDTVTDVVPFAPAIEIAKTPDLQTVVSGSTVTFTITVTNTGSVPLTNVTVTDPLAPDCARTFASLDPGASESYICTVTNVTADFTNVATVTGTPPVGDDVTASDPADVEVIGLTPTPTPTSEPSEPKPSEPEPPTSTPVPPAPVTPTPTVEVVTVERLPETGGLPGWVTIALGVPLIIGAASLLLNLALLEKRGRRGDGKGH